MWDPAACCMASEQPPAPVRHSHNASELSWSYSPYAILASLYLPGSVRFRCSPTSCVPPWVNSGTQELRGWESTFLQDCIIRSQFQCEPQWLIKSLQSIACGTAVIQCLFLLSHDNKNLHDTRPSTFLKMCKNNYCNCSLFCLVAAKVSKHMQGFRD